MTWTVRVITQSLEANTSEYMMIVTCWRLIVQSQAEFQRNHTYMLQIWAKSIKTQNCSQKRLKKFKASDSYTVRKPLQRGWAKIRIRSYSPKWLWRCRSRGYRQLCSLWFEYDLFLDRKPPNDLESCLTTLIQIRSTSDPKEVKLWFGYDQEAP